MAAESHRRPEDAPAKDDFGDDLESTTTDPDGARGPDGSNGTDTADEDHNSRGATDGPLEDDLEDAFDRLVEEGTQRLGRTKTEILVTGFFGGTEVAVGVLALVFTYHETGSHLLAGLAFSIGFLALLLAKSELFTEGFLVPVFAVAAKRARPWHLLRLWGGVLVANLVGGWLIMWLVVLGFPDLHKDLVSLASDFVETPFGAEGFCLAVLAGAAITLMTRMQSGSDEMVAKMGAAIGIGFLLAGTGLFHSILDSLLIFGALHTGDAPFGYVDYLGWIVYVLVGNMVGGLGLVTGLRLLRSRERIAEERTRLRKEERQARPSALHADGRQQLARERRDRVRAEMKAQDDEDQSRASSAEAAQHG